MILKFITLFSKKWLIVKALGIIIMTGVCIHKVSKVDFKEILEIDSAINVSVCIYYATNWHCCINENNEIL